MSRTYKDKPSKLKGDAWGKDREYYNYTRVWVTYSGELVEHEWKAYMETKTTKTKKRKEVDTEDHWTSTPGWHIRMWMNKPQRRKHHLQEKACLKAIDIEEVDFPELGRKPHIYFW